AQPALLEQALARAAADCVALDGAQAVVIGGGPLGQAAAALAQSLPVPVISPLACAARWMHQRLLPAQSPPRIPLPTL
ncbi:MAG: hypothetical protein QM569_02465, partial [Acidovorax sp.]